MKLKKLLQVVKGDIVICVKEPEQCMQFETTLKNGKPNIHIDENDLNRTVYDIFTLCGKIHAWVW